MTFATDYRLENYIIDSKWEDFPKEVHERAVVCAIDLTIALLLGSRGKQHEVGVKTAKRIYQPGEIPIVGSRETFSFMGAVTAMAHSSNSFDIDDGHNFIKGHPGASFVGGALAAALDRDVTYREYLEALIVSYEVTIRWALAMQDHYNYLHSTGAYGAFGTAAGVGRIFKLDRETLNNALSIADFHAPMTPVMRAVEYPSMNKDGVPFGAFTGAMAVVEALEGYKGKTHLLEMPKYKYLLDTLGAEYRIMELYFKPFTCCRWAHQPISACIDLMKERGFKSADVKSVVVYTFEAAARLSKIVPHSTDEAQYNIAYPVAAALVHGDLGYPQIRDEALGDKKVTEMMEKLEFVVEPELEAQFPEKRLSWVEIELFDGKRLRSDIYAAPGEASDGVDLNWITEKFARITAPLISPSKQRDILSSLSEPGNVKIRQIIEIINM